MYPTFTYIELIYKTFKIQIILFFLYVLKYDRRGGIMRQIMHEYCYICCGGGQL